MDTKKKIQYIVGGFLILAIGGVIGVSGAGLYFERHKAAICPARTEIKTALSDDKALTALVPGRIIFGKIVTKESGKFTILGSLVNPVHPEEKKDVEIPIPVTARDIFFHIQRNADGVMQPIAVTYNEAKVGMQVTVKILDGGKKEIYLPIQK